jgi:curved DNA-binding protein CbpA
MPTPDWYAVLGVAPTATRDEIGTAFRRGMKACHPDLFPGDVEKGARARALSGAKSVLGDEKRRAAYDAFRARPKPPPKAARPDPEPRAKSEPPPKAKPAPKPAAAKAPRKKKAPKISARPPRPKPSSRLAVEYLGLRRYAGRSWQQAVTRMHRQATQALNPGKRLPTMRLVEIVVKQPGLVELRFAYGKGRRRTVMGPHVAKLYWAKP